MHQRALGLVARWRVVFGFTGAQMGGGDDGKGVGIGLKLLRQVGQIGQLDDRKAQAMATAKDVKLKGIRFR